MSKKTMQLARVFACLGDGTRLSLVKVLAKGERNVSTLCRLLDLAQPTASHHLGVLRAHKIVTCRRDGKQVFYRLSPKRLASALGFLGMAVDKAGEPT